MKLTKKQKLKAILFIVGILVVAGVAFINPQHTETVARAFLVFLGIL
jgi:hypothetical protein